MTGKLELILPENGDYKITPESYEVIKRYERESNMRNIAIYDLKDGETYIYICLLFFFNVNNFHTYTNYICIFKALLDGELSMTWNEKKFEYSM